jgi:hypothetical protein
MFHSSLCLARYLYLLFTPDEDIPIDLDDYVFSTEAHLLPTNLAHCDLNYVSACYATDPLQCLIHLGRFRSKIISMLSSITTIIAVSTVLTTKPTSFEW